MRMCRSLWLAVSTCKITQKKYFHAHAINLRKHVYFTGRLLKYFKITQYFKTYFLSLMRYCIERRNLWKNIRDFPICTFIILLKSYLNHGTMAAFCSCIWKSSFSDPKLAWCFVVFFLRERILRKNLWKQWYVLFYEFLFRVLGW